MNEWWLMGFLLLIGFCASLLICYPLRRHVLFCTLFIPFIMLMEFGAYSSWGGFRLWQQHVQEQRAKDQALKVLKTVKSPQELIEKLKLRLEKNPDSAKGWYLLGRLYSSQQQQTEAVKAFAKAHQLQPTDEQFTVNYAHSLWIANHQQFNPKIKGLFNRLLENNPNQPDALAMLAMDAYSSQNYETAISYWQRLLKLVPRDSEESKALQKAIEKAHKKL